MKQLKMTCKKCGKQKIITGETADEIIATLNKSGWLDEYNEGEFITYCSNCAEWREQQP